MVNNKENTNSISINVGKELGITASVYIREIARKLPAFDMKFDSQEEGLTNEGESIPINTIGRWLFGVPGYEGHARIVAVNDSVQVYFPKDLPAGVSELLSSLKDKIEKHG
jgi:hypothetical protein